MSSTNLKMKAICLILLLGGQEAYRIQGNAQMSLAMQKSLKPADNRWNQADKRCTWKIHKGGCSGDGCTFRPLPLDTSLSESCRLSDAYMLSSATTRDEFVDIASQVLEEKSAKFKNACADLKLWELSKQLHCHRRAGRMFRSAQLLSRAAKTQESIRSEKQEHIERALNNIASAFGTDGKHLLDYKDKLKGDFLSIAKDPTGKFKQMISTVSKLLTGSKRDKDQARRVITRMPSKNVTRVSEKDSKEIERVVKKLTHEYDLQKPEVVSEVWSNLDHLMTNQTHEKEGSALLQVEGAASSQYMYGFSIDSTLLVVVVLILIILLVIPGVNAAVLGPLITVIVVILVLILIVMLVKFLLGSLGFGNGKKRGTDRRRGGNRRSSNRRY